MALLVVSIVGLGLVVVGMAVQATGALGTGVEMQVMGATIAACVVRAGLGRRGSH